MDISICKIKSLVNASESQLFESFSKAFIDYPFQWTKDGFRKIMKPLSYDSAISNGVFYNKNLVIFILKGIVKNNTEIGAIHFFEKPANFKISSGKWNYIMNMYTILEFRRNGICIEILKLLIEEKLKLGVSACYTSRRICICTMWV